MVAPTVVYPTTAPSRDMASDVYVPTANAWAASLPAFGASMQEVADYCETSVDDIAALLTVIGISSTSTTSLAIGTGAKTLFLATDIAIVPGMFIIAADAAAPTTNFMLGQVSDYDAGTGELDFLVPSDGASGSGTKTSWIVSLSGPKGLDAQLRLTPEARTSNAAMIPADSGKTIDATGTFTQTFNAPGTLGAGWFQVFNNRGTGVHTLALATNELLQPGESSIITCDGSTLKSIRVAVDLGPHVVIQDQKTTGTAGGAATVATYVTRDLNTIVRNVGGASLATNQFTLPAGTWMIEGRAPAYNNAGSRARIRNITDSTTVAIGPSAFTAANVPVFNTVIGFVTITSAKAFELQHKKTANANGNDFGGSSSDGEIEIYSEIRATRIA